MAIDKFIQAFEEEAGLLRCEAALIKYGSGCDYESMA